MAKLDFKELNSLQNINASLGNKGLLEDVKSNIKPSKSSKLRDKLKPANKSELKSRGGLDNFKKDKSNISSKSHNYKTDIPTKIDSRDNLSSSSNTFQNKYLSSMEEVKQFTEENREKIDSMDSESKQQLVDDFKSEFTIKNPLNKSGQYDKHFEKQFRHKLIHDTMHMGKGANEMGKKFATGFGNPVPDPTSLGVGGYVAGKLDQFGIDHADKSDYRNQIYAEGKELSYDFDDYRDAPPIGITDYDELKQASKRKYVGLKDTTDKYYKMRKYIARNHRDILKVLNKDKNLGFVERIKLKRLIKKIAKSENNSLSKKIVKLIIKHLLRKFLAPVYTTVFLLILLVAFSTPIKSDIGTKYDTGDLIKVANIFGKKDKERRDAIALAKWEDEEEQRAEKLAEELEKNDKSGASDVNRFKHNLDGSENSTADGGGGSSGATTGHTQVAHNIPNSIPEGTPSSKAFKVACEQYGKPYKWGGTGPNVFDCSGLWWYCFKHGANMEMTTPAQTQCDIVKKLGNFHPASDMKAGKIPPGSLLFFKKGAKKVHHVGMYIGMNEKGQHVYYHSPQSGKTVGTAILEYRHDFYGGGLPYK